PPDHGADGYAVAGPPRAAVAALAAGAAVLLTTSAVAGHATVQSPVALLLSLNVVHVAAMCAWLGVLAGIGQTIVHVDRLEALTGTAFGSAILIKTALLGLLIGLGALNRQRTLPRLRALAAARERRPARHPCPPAQPLGEPA